MVFVFSSKTGNDFWNKDFKTGRRSIIECCTCWGKNFFWRLSKNAENIFELDVCSGTRVCGRHCFTAMLGTEELEDPLAGPVGTTALRNACLNRSLKNNRVNYGQSKPRVNAYTGGPCNGWSSEASTTAILNAGKRIRVTHAVRLVKLSCTDMG